MHTGKMFKTIIIIIRDVQNRKKDLDKTVEIVNNIVVHSGQFTGTKYY